MNLSYKNWDNVFNSASDNDVNAIFNNFLNMHLRIFYCSFPLHTYLVRKNVKGGSQKVY